MKYFYWAEVETWDGVIFPPEHSGVVDVTSPIKDEKGLQRLQSAIEKKLTKLFGHRGSRQGDPPMQAEVKLIRNFRPLP